VPETPRAGDQPLPSAGTGPSMHDLVCDDIRARCGEFGYATASAAVVTASLQARKRLGFERYGRLLQAHNERDALRDLREELEDAVVYARQVLEEDRLDHGGKASVRIAYEALISMLFEVREAHDSLDGAR
jgi:hypothetical protein